MRAVCKPHSPDLKRGTLATVARGCSLWRSLLERLPPALESRVRDPLGELVWTRVGGVTPASIISFLIGTNALFAVTGETSGKKDSVALSDVFTGA